MKIWYSQSVLTENPNSLANFLNTIEKNGFNVFTVVYESACSVLVIYTQQGEENGSQEEKGVAADVGRVSGEVQKKTYRKRSNQA